MLYRLKLWVPCSLNWYSEGITEGKGEENKKRKNIGHILEYPLEEWNI